MVAAVLITAAAIAAAGDPGPDIDRLPDAVVAPIESAPAPVPDLADRTRLFFEAAPKLNVWRSGLAVPPPAANRPDLTNRLSLDARSEFDLGAGGAVTLADRFNVLSETGRDFSSRDDLRNDLKEVYLTWSVGGAGFVDAGRINVKNGVALGFNPTDYFKTDAVVQRISEDPGVLRDNRLGSLMLRGQMVWGSGALALLWAPSVKAEPGHWWTDGAVVGLGLDRTNRDDRFLVRGTATLARDLAPELLVYHAAGRSQFGLNLTHGLGDAAVGYLEWSGGQRPDLITEALDDARRRGTVALSASTPLAVETGSRFRSQAAVGFSYTLAADKITTNLEYHFNQAALSGEDWDRWFQAGQNPTARGQLWLIRRFAQDTGQPASRHSLFLRAFWQDALWPALDLTGLADVSLQDGGSFAQIEAAYPLSSRISLGLTLGASAGGRYGERGSQPLIGSLLGALRVYF